MLRERQEVARQLIGGCSYSAGGKFYESLNAFVRVAKRTVRRIGQDFPLKKFSLFLGMSAVKG